MRTARSTSSNASATVIDRRGTKLPLEMLGNYARINVKGGLPVAEAFAWHEKLIERRGRWAI